MRYKDISGKEIVDITSGVRLGVLGQTDIEIQINSGAINAFVIPSYKWLGLRKEGIVTRIPWYSIIKIGEDMIMIENIE